MNTTGHLYRLTSFGESHGAAVGGVIDGIPAGLQVDLEALQRFVDRRRPGQSPATTQRNERDQVEFLSGIFEGRTLGTPIGFLVRNEDCRSQDYDLLRDVYRPSHADYAYQARYGIRDHRGGGRASARVTLPRMVAGALAAQALAELGVTVSAYTVRIGPVEAALPAGVFADGQVDASLVRCPDPVASPMMLEALAQARADGDSLGGAVVCVARGVPAGWGAPVEAKLHADLAAAMMGINAAKAFEMGDGVALGAMRGSEANDPFVAGDPDCLHTSTNHGGGVAGGITTGEDLVMRVTFKPTPTLARPQTSVDTSGREVSLPTSGRHDPCVVPRAVPVVQATAAMVLLDHCLLSRVARWR